MKNRVKKFLIMNFKKKNSLRKNYDAKTVNYACGRALNYNAFSYKVVKRICEKGIIEFSTETNISYINTETTYTHR
ncbi:hypothetical protein JMF89_10595 [Clostridiaceae bacterium UIB06]|uniref:Uncharacterized protein n=1 Tax=Clostridium thailandense TaxID=2794346 RepID=A0A949X252_9CLOT|nr:hypothetical protein [Clostridium thailandense]MBV7272809.1 hypothetical protein [Clostridium thailandense]MCH5137650.1 hypothetical protein [Clostridiaceae bacterium UIB06]